MLVQKLPRYYQLTAEPKEKGEQPMLHPHTELRFINEQIGYGIVATHLIPCGTVTWVRDAFDQAFSLAQVERMAPLYRDIVAKYATPAMSPADRPLRCPICAFGSVGVMVSCPFLVNASRG